MENYVAQTLKSKGYELFYYAKNDNDIIENNMKVDFLIVQDKKINPIEVKSGEYKKPTSIDNVVYLPLYMAIFL